MVNLAVIPDIEEIVVFDWQRAGVGPATIDTSWFVLSGRVFFHKDAFFDYYRHRLAAHLGDRFEPGLWTAMRDLGCLAEVLHKGNWVAYGAAHAQEAEDRENARRLVAHYNDFVRRGIAWL